MATKAAQQGLVSAKLIGRWEQIGQKLTALAEEAKATSITNQLRGCARLPSCSGT